MRLFSRRRAVLAVAFVMAMPVLWAAPASAASALVVVPDKDLVDLQSVDVTGTGFPANTDLGLAQCINGATDPITDCDLGLLQIPHSDANGSFSTSFTVRRIIETGGGEVDCAPSNCSLISSDLNLGSPALAPLQFDPNVPPQPRLKVEVTVDPKGTVVSKTGEVTIRGTASCNLPADVSIDAFVEQRAGRVLIDGDAFSEFPCDGTVQWSATGQGFNGIFKGGPAQVDAFANASTETESASTEVLASINLTGAGKK